MQNKANDSFLLQSQLGLYCRTGKNKPTTSIDENIFQYRRLVYSIVKDSLEKAFPISREILGKERWKKLAKVFFENHKCKTPQVWKLPSEFLDYYSENDFPFKKDFFFLKELLQYEWLEIEVFMMEDIETNDFDTKIVSNKDILIPNPEIKIQSLNYPIHKKKINKISKKDKGQYFVAIHRDYYTKQVVFSDLSYIFVEMLIKINEEELSINNLKEVYSKYEKDKKIVNKEVTDFINFSIKNTLILGTKNKQLNNKQN